MKYMILDGNSLANRAFYGVRALNAPDGTPTNAIFGFLNIFNRLMAEINPDAVSVAFDLKEKTFRHQAFDTYKAQRKGMPEDLAVQMPILRQVLEAMNIHCYTCPGFEADDILGTVGRICEENGWECVIVTGDRDSLQLITDKVSVCLIKTRGGQTETLLYTPESFIEEYGFAPAGMIDLKALMGDSSDNIPGVPGIGEKTANDLMKSFGSLEKIYTSLSSPEIKESVRKKLTEGEQSARDSYWLATIMKDVPVSVSPEDDLWDHDFTPALYDQLLKLGFGKLIEKWHLSASENRPAEAEIPEQALNTVSLTDEEDVKKAFLSAVQSSPFVSFSASDDLSSFSCCTGDTVYSVSRTGCMLSFDELLDAVLAPDVRKVTQDLKPLLRRLIEARCSFGGFIFDTALAAYLISSTDSDYSAEKLAIRMLGRELTGVQAIYELYAPLKQKLKDLSLETLYETAELPLCIVLAEMETEGFLVDRQALSDFGENLNGAIEALQQSIWDHAGEPFNINSPKQLGEILFDRLCLPYGKKTKTGWSTNADVLEKLQGFHPIIGEVLEYRMLTKLKSTYADGLLKVISSDGRIHTNFQMTVTATGRLSSTEPNLQNIPVRKQLGSQMRRMFIAPKGSVLVDADYSQIELRLLAHISKDQTMIDAFLSGEDFHAVTASNVFHVPLEEVTPAMRSSAKAVNFGIVYGISAFSLAQDINVMPREAQAYIDAYFREYSGVQQYMTDVVEKAKSDGYVTTLYGRRRDIPELKNSKYAVRQFGERVALNMPIQGTAADIMKLAMIDAYHALKESGLKAKLVLQVHDELIVECPEEEAEQVSSILKNSMSGIASLSVPLVVDVHAGKSWAEAH
ncbi:MAG: DNA polymerase I [Oscillospiraceae bacterium]|nr:DNA polymerase I [Oscillospiraceae bacterium]